MSAQNARKIHAITSAASESSKQYVHVEINHTQRGPHQEQNFLTSSAVLELGVPTMCAYDNCTLVQPVKVRPVAKRLLIDASRYCHFGLNHTDGTLLITRDLFRPHLSLLLSSQVECGGWFEGSFTGVEAGAGRGATLEIGYAGLLPTQYWGKDGDNDFVDIPTTTKWFANRQKLGMWHLHRIDLPPTVQDIYDEFAIVVIRKRSWLKLALELYLISRTPFSKISLVSSNTTAHHGDAGEASRETTVTTTIKPPWKEIKHTVLDIIDQKRFALPSSLKIDNQTGLIQENRQLLRRRGELLNT